MTRRSVTHTTASGSWHVPMRRDVARENICPGSRSAWKPRLRVRLIAILQRASFFRNIAVHDQFQSKSGTLKQPNPVDGT
jgi:hypothetical protein